MGDGISDGLNDFPGLPEADESDEGFGQIKGFLRVSSSGSGAVYDLGDLLGPKVAGVLMKAEVSFTFSPDMFDPPLDEDQVALMEDKFTRLSRELVDNAALNLLLTPSSEAGQE